jgi:hypothetical protein
MKSKRPENQLGVFFCSFFFILRIIILNIHNIKKDFQKDDFKLKRRRFIMTSNNKNEKYQEFAKGGVVANVHIGRYRCEAKIKGVKGENNSYDFLHFGKIKFLPAGIEKKLSHIESNVRYTLKKLSLTENYMLLKDYEEFKVLYESKRNEYFDVRDEIYNSWDDIIDKYKNNLSKVQHLDISRAYIPSKDEYKRSFYMDMDVSMLPMFNLEELNENFNEIKEELKATNKLHQERFLQDVQVKMINELLEIISSFTKKEKEETKKFSRRSAEEKIEKIKERSFSVLVDSSVKLTEDLLSKRNKPNIVENLAEATLIKIYKLSKDKGLDSMVDWKNSFVQKEILEQMSEILSDEEVA